MNSAHSASARISLAPLYWLALGTFAVGTESFMIAGLLPDMAADLHTSIVATGQLVTDAVHAKGGRIFLQLYHAGRQSNSQLQPGGAEPVAPSAVPHGGVAYTERAGSRTRRAAR